MAKQQGAVLMSGTLDDLTFYKRGNRYFIRKHNPVPRERILTETNFKRTRENSTEFGKVASDGKLLRNSIAPLLLCIKDGAIHNRLVKLLMQVMRSDGISERGKRSINKGNLSLLTGFEFNSHAMLPVILGVGIKSSINRATGELLLEVPSFVPGMVMSAPAGATHYKIVSAGVQLDFDNRDFSSVVKETEALPINYAATAALRVEQRMAADTLLPMIVVVGVQFFQQINGVLYPLKSGGYNALRVVEAHP